MGYLLRLDTRTLLGGRPHTCKELRSADSGCLDCVAHSIDLASATRWWQGGVDTFGPGKAWEPSEPIGSWTLLRGTKATSGRPDNGPLSLREHFLAVLWARNNGVCARASTRLGGRMLQDSDLTPL